MKQEGNESGAMSFDIFESEEPEFEEEVDEDDDLTIPVEDDSEELNFNNFDIED